VWCHACAQISGKEATGRPDFIHLEDEWLPGHQENSSDAMPQQNGSRGREIMKLVPIAIGAAALALSACGGGGDSGPQQQTQSATISGVAATGAAMPGATLTAQCATGAGATTTGTGTTGADGTYKVIFGNDIVLPCVLTATSSDGSTVLHSVVPGSGPLNSATSNVTPLTELLLAQFAGQNPAKWAATFSAGTTVSADDVNTAQKALVSLLQTAGFDASGISDFIGGSISAGSGQGYDGVLDGLQTKLTKAGATLSDLSTAVASTSGSSAAAAGSTIGTVMAPANPACPSFKSGTHRLIKFSDGSEQDVAIDATGLSATVGGASYTLTAGTGTEACSFTLNDTGATRVLVAKSGLATWTNGSGSTGTLSLSMPKQTIDPATVNGGYNFIALSGPAQGAYGTHNYAKGVTTAATNCSVGYPCEVDTASPYGHLVATPDGGADWVDDGSATAGTVDYHAYGFQNAQGNTVWVATMNSGTGKGVGIFAPQTALTVPAVGTVSAYWQSSVTASGLSAPIEDRQTITAVNGSTVTRTFASDSSTDQLTYNNPFDGMRHRALNACATAAGAASPCKESWHMTLGGITYSVSGNPWGTTSTGAPNNTFRVNVSVTKPSN